MPLAPTHSWDLSLPFVMGAALFLALPAYQVVLRLKLVPHPALKQRYDMPTATDIDGRLLLGGVMFGAGWGLSGICPGPALVSHTHTSTGCKADKAAWTVLLSEQGMGIMATWLGS